MVSKCTRCTDKEASRKGNQHKRQEVCSIGIFITKKDCFAMGKYSYDGETFYKIYLPMQLFKCRCYG